MDVLVMDSNKLDLRPFAQANADSQNTGVLDVNGDRLPPVFVAHVDDHLYADNKEYFPRGVAASVVGLDDSFGGSHVFQEDVLSDEKLRLIYKELRIVLGFQPNNRTMMVEISPR